MVGGLRLIWIAGVRSELLVPGDGYYGHINLMLRLY